MGRREGGELDKETPLAKILPPFNVPTHSLPLSVCVSITLYYDGRAFSYDTLRQIQIFSFSLFCSPTLSCQLIPFLLSYLKRQWQICKWNNLKSKWRDRWMDGWKEIITLPDCLNNNNTNHNSHRAHRNFPVVEDFVRTSNNAQNNNNCSGKKVLTPKCIFFGCQTPLVVCVCFVVVAFLCIVITWRTSMTLTSTYPIVMRFTRR